MGNLSPQKAAFARPAQDAELAQKAGTDLSRAVKLVRPDSLIGAAAQGGAFSESVIKALTKVLCLLSRFLRFLHGSSSFAECAGSVSGINAVVEHASAQELCSRADPDTRGTLHRRKGQGERAA